MDLRKIRRRDNYDTEVNESWQLSRNRRSRSRLGDRIGIKGCSEEEEEFDEEEEVFDEEEEVFG